MKITFIVPSMGKRHTKEKYPKGWLMEPLAIAVLSALTPSDIHQEFFDDRCDAIPYSPETDLVAITVETYTAKRAYQIADKYMELDVPVILGGCHPTLVPDEAGKHSDAVCIGEAENIWHEIIEDIRKGRLKRRYCGRREGVLEKLRFNRKIYEGKPYLKLTLVETSRGCMFDCEFCTVSAFFNQTYRSRPVNDVINELRTLNGKDFFFVDDNIGMDMERFRELLKALIPLKIRWSAQVSIHIAKDESILELMRRSGCMLVLIGFESLNPDILNMMGKRVNSIHIDYDKYLALFRKHKIAIYGTFVFGYPGESENSFKKTLEFVRKQKMFFAAINHLVPFPGTSLYSRLKKEGKLLFDAWYLKDDYHFGEISFKPASMTAKELTMLTFKWRCKTYTWNMIFWRAMNFRGNCSSLRKALIFFYSNLLSSKEVRKRQTISLGLDEE